MINLKRELFRDDLESEMPEKMKLFTTWINVYYEPSIFYELPYKMQVVMLKRFFLEMLEMDVEIADNIKVAYVRIGKGFFKI